MAKFELQLPKDIMNDIKKIYDNADDIFGEMTQAGAEVVESNIRSNVPKGVKSSNMMKCLKTTRVYKTKDGAINTKVGWYGYFKNRNGEDVPADEVAKVFEYGRSNSPFPKHPFMRKSFKKNEIEEAMRKAQKRASGGIIDE